MPARSPLSRRRCPFFLGMTALLLAGGASTVAQAAVFECAGPDGPRVFQATPCPESSARGRRDDLPALVAIKSQPTAVGAVVDRPRRSGAAYQPPYTERDVRACRSMHHQIDALDARMRAGYGAADGVRLQARRDVLVERRQLACESVPQHRWMGG